MSWVTSSGSPPEWEVKGKAWTRVNTGPLLTPGSSPFRDLAEVRTLLGGFRLIRIGVWCPSVEVRTPRYILGCVAFSCHMAPFGLPMRWGQTPSSAWPGDVAWVRRLHAVEEGTPGLGYRQITILGKHPKFFTCFKMSRGPIDSLIKSRMSFNSTNNSFPSIFEYSPLLSAASRFIEQENNLVLLVYNTCK
jgi:hypothetical protein